MNIEFNPKPVRNIGVTKRSVSGIIPQFGRYESTLERDFMELVRFNDGVSECFPQPVEIPYFDANGCSRTYTPDGLLKFKSELNEPPVLYEIKYRQDFRSDWRALLTKFRVAKSYCLQIGWRFEVYTEREIRTQYLQSVKFLWPYRERVPSEEAASQLIEILLDLDETDPETLLCALYRDPRNRALTIPVIWHLVSIGAIGCDLDKPITMHSRIWAAKDV